MIKNWISQFECEMTTPQTVHNVLFCLFRPWYSWQPPAGQSTFEHDRPGTARWGWQGAR